MHKNRSVTSIGKHLFNLQGCKLFRIRVHTAVVRQATASPAPEQTDGQLQLSNPQQHPSSWPLNFAHYPQHCHQLMIHAP